MVPFIILSIPLSFLGAKIHIDVHTYKLILAGCLVIATLRILGFSGKGSETGIKELKFIPAILIGGLLGFVQLSAALFMLFSYMDLNDVSHLAFEESHIWFAQWNINYHIGVDAISIAMILLTSIVLVAGVLVSWNIENKPKEFFFLLVMLASGAFGFFISQDLFTQFFFFELAVIPKFLLIAIWGSGKKEYAAMKLVLMLMGGSSLVLMGILGFYFYSSQAGTPSFDLATLSH